MPRFSLAPRVSIREEDFGGLAFVRATGVTLRLSPGAYHELLGLRGRDDAREIAEDDEKRLRFYRKLCRFQMVHEVTSDETS